ncbi:MAG TPA: TonB-dependent receptor [Terracidiphilus sp.]|nr:TonB-dependent receptor [Terracidiphilus sp.]
MEYENEFETKLVRPRDRQNTPSVEPETSYTSLKPALKTESLARRIWVAALCSLALVLMPQQNRAQLGGSGAIEGTVTDSTGAVVPGARVTAKSDATGVEMERITNRDGRYSLSPLDAGTYKVTVSAKGFATLVREKMQVNGLQVIGLDFALQVGVANTVVTVTAEPPPLETEDATLGATMENEVYQSLPLEMGGANGVSTDQRRATDYAVLMPGVTNNEIKNNESDEPMVVNGNANSTEMYIEGIPLESASVSGDPRFIWPAFSVETIDQFQLKTTAYSAEYQGLGVENFTTKRGTNDFHGSLYEVIRNTALDSAGFIPAQYPANYPNAALAGTWYKPPEHMNEYGITFGGPIWRNKVFFFGNYSGFRFITLTKPQFQTIPTPAELCGDFSAVAGSQPIYDPTTQTETGGSYSRTQFSGPTWTASGGCGSGPVANNVIPQAEISPIAKYLQKLIPAPTNSNATNNYLGSYPWGLNNWSTANRIDVDFSDKHKLSVIGSVGRQGLVGAAGSQTTDVLPLPYEYAKTYAPISYVGILQDTYVITSNLVNQFKYGAAKYHSPDYNPTYGIADFAATAAGITGLPAAGQAPGSFPVVKFSGADAPAQWGPQTGYKGNTDAYTLLDNLQWIRGKHSLTFGGQYEWMSYNYLYAIGGTTPVTLNFAVTETAQVSGSSASTVSATGMPYASFLLGAVDSGTYTEYASNAQETGARYHPFALYANDDWKLTPRLTVNAGLRWDSMPPMREVQNRFSFLDPTATNPVTGSPGTLEFAGSGTDSCNCTTPMKTYYKDFGPRLGLAYELGDKTVIHAAYGIYYAHGGGTSGGATALPSTTMELGFAAAPNPTEANVGDSLPAFYLNNSNFNSNPAFSSTAFGSSTVAPPPVYNPAYATYYSSLAVSPYKVSSTLGYLDPFYGGRTPTFEGWSIGFQRLLTPNITATVSYVGNQGHFLLPTGAARGIWNNQLDPAYLSLGSSVLGATASTSNMPNGSLPYATFNSKVSQALLPFPQFSGVSAQVDSVGNSNYNSLQLTVQQRMAHGLTFMLSYTYSKTIDDVGTFRTGYAIPAGILANSGKAWPIDRIERSLSTQDQPQNLVATSTYDLPFGKGHIGDGNAIVRNIVGGWRLSDIFTYVAGNPLAITSSTCTGTSGQGTCMPAYNTSFSGPVRQNGSWGAGATRTTLGSIQYINPAAFLQTGSLVNTATCTAGTSACTGEVLGDLARTAPFGLRGPGNYDIDGSLRRTFDLWREGRVKFIFEAQVFNAVNHVWFGSTAATADGSIGSSVTSSTASKDTALGAVAGQANNPRQWQFAGHITF